MHEENNRSTRYLYRANRAKNLNSQLNLRIGYVTKIPRICGGGITSGGSGSSGVVLVLL